MLFLSDIQFWWTAISIPGILNGNWTNRGIKLSHWNAGNANLENEINEIENIIADHHPHLLGISEANLKNNHCFNNCKISDYDLITCKNENESLQTSLQHSSVVAKVREDLMSEWFSSIWLEVGFPGRTRFLVCNLYGTLYTWREVSVPKQSDKKIS